MKAVIQRVRRAHVAVDQEIVGSIEHGLWCTLGSEREIRSKTSLGCAIKSSSFGFLAVKQAR